MTLDQQFREEQLRPHFPPRIPLALYPPRCPQCRAFLDKLGPLVTAAGNKIFRIKCRNNHQWLEIEL